MNHKFLRSHSERLSEFAKATSARAASSPDDFFLQLAAKNQRAAARDVCHQLAIAEADASGELVDFRLIGPRADGSIPLETFLRAMDPFVKACKYAAHRLRHGQEAVKGAAEEIAAALNLKLAGLTPGSTHVLVTGDARPDMTGESLFQSTLLQLFRLLNAKTDDFYDAVDAVGGKSAHQLSELMKELSKAGLAAEMTWKAKDGIQHWEGRPDEILRVRALIERLQEPEAYQEIVCGRVAGIRDTGLLELRSEEGKISIRYPLKLTEQVQLLKISAPARIKVKTTKYWDEVHKRHIFKRQLTSVEI